jgi:hypothetical protein
MPVGLHLGAAPWVGLASGAGTEYGLLRPWCLLVSSGVMQPLY